MVMINRIKCFLGFHGNEWHDESNEDCLIQHSKCVYCGKTEQLLSTPKFKLTLYGKEV